jgi:hypothetical protein
MRRGYKDDGDKLAGTGPATLRKIHESVIDNFKRICSISFPPLILQKGSKIYWIFLDQHDAFKWLLLVYLRGKVNTPVITTSPYHWVKPISETFSVDFVSLC